MTNPSESALQPQYVRARYGDFAVVLVAEDEWVLGEVMSVTKGDGRVKLLATSSGDVKVGPHHMIRLIGQRKVNRQRAFGLVVKAPPIFRAWEQARDYMTPALLQTGEQPEDYKAEPAA